MKIGTKASVGLMESNANSFPQQYFPLNAALCPHKGILGTEKNRGGISKFISRKIISKN